MMKHNYSNNITKIEKWIENYGNEGYVLTKVCGLGNKYEFQKITDNSFIPKVRIDYHIFSKADDFSDYIAIFEDSGWSHIYGNKNSGYQYFQQQSPDSTAEIFSDSTSKAAPYKRIALFWLGMFSCYLPLFIALQSSGSLKLFNLFHIKDMYYTPGLWERTGDSFWSGFLFETPFAVGRAAGSWIFVILTFGFLFTAARAMYWYYSEKKS